MRRVMVPSIGCVIVAFALTGCTQDLEQATQDAERVAGEGAERLAEGLRGVAEGLAGMAESARPPVDPVDFRQLQRLFPDIDGWEKGPPSGQQMSSPVAYAEAEVVYTESQGGRVEVSIIDSAFHGLLLTPVSMLFKSGFEREDEFGYQRATEVAGSPGWETWDSREGSADLTVVHNERFLLTLEGHHLSTPDVLRQVVDGIDRTQLPTTGGEPAETEEAR